MLKRFYRWMDKQMTLSEERTLAYWRKEVSIAATRLAFCRVALNHYEREAAK
jgi:primosomal protein N''